MRVLLFCNNRVGWQLLKWFVDTGETIVGVVIHPPETGKYRSRILQEIDRLPACPVFDGSRLFEPAVLQAIANLKPEIGISLYFGYILKPELLNIFRIGVLNLHPGLLPYNRGAHPNVWSIVEGTPSGVTLHFMDEGIDTGDIVVQREVRVEPTDTGLTLYRRLEDAAIALLKDSWSTISSGAIPRTPQPRHRGTFHKRQDLRKLNRLDLDKTYRARDLINILRARTFPPYRGTYFEANGRRVYVSIMLEDEVEKDESNADR